MGETREQSNPLSGSKLIGRCIVSCIFVFLTHLALSLIPRFFSAFSFLTQLALSALLLLVILGFGGWCRRTLLRAKASAFSFSSTFSSFGDFTSLCAATKRCRFQLGVVFLFIGFYSIMTSDPSIVTNRSASSTQPMEISISHGSGLGMRVRYFKSCKAYGKGLDHHCPAFGNCIGQKNHPLFLILLFGFISTETSYLVCSSLSVSTILFTILQLVVFVIWHIYCVCVNSRTDEWINWMKYEEFQLVVQPCQDNGSQEFLALTT
ncbi:hypothetical protein M0R45_031239 [Rubus argutus]|uniref:S-acyltransferase n=1 Tax=Rubus argutus TaxID=59490 RepID=A0AAW1WDH0_RUBAR